MPNARNEAPRLRTGTVASGSITSTYAWTNFTVQNDQKDGNEVLIPWVPPFQMLPPEYARVAIAMDGTARPDGFFKGVFGPFSYLTFGMMSYVLSTHFAASVYSAPLSAMFYDITDTLWYINATFYRPIPGQDMDPAFGGWANVKIRYDFGATAA